jgi:hypothetical protein
MGYQAGDKLLDIIHDVNLRTRDKKVVWNLGISV